jgi:hypothetical protein
MGLKNAGSYSNAGDRVANYDLVDEQISDLQAKGLTGDEYIAEANRILNHYGTFDSIELSGTPRLPAEGSSAKDGELTLSYNTSNAGSEKISLTYDTDKAVNGTGFVSLSSFERASRGAGSVSYDFEVGRIGNKPAIKIGNKYYYINSQFDTADNRAFMLYLSSFKEKDKNKNEKWESFTDQIWRSRTKG